MARTRMIQLGDSWVVETDGDFVPSEESTIQDATSQEATSQETSREGSNSSLDTPQSNRETRLSRKKSTEPELIMPSLDEGAMDGSGIAIKRRVDSSMKALQNRRMDAQENRRRSPRVATQRQSSTDSPTKPRGPKSKQVPRSAPRQSPSQTPSQIFTETLEAIGLWILGTLRMALSMLKYPAMVLSAVMILVFVLLLLAGSLRSLVSNAISAPFSPVCQLPGISVLCQLADRAQAKSPPIQFDEMMTVQSKFEDVLESSADSVTLPLDMKRGEASIRDLRQLVRYSSLRSKNELALEFDGFIETARIASFDLQKYNSHIGRAVDIVLATTRWTMRVLDDIAIRDASRGAINVFLHEKVLWPLRPVEPTEAALLDQYIQHTRAVEDEINKLVEEAQKLLLVLVNLETRLDVIHDIVARENGHALASREEILSHVWTILGGNRNTLGRVDRQMKLLQDVGNYRATAYAHVSGTVLRLQGIAAGLEDLRERVGAPEMLRGRVHVPLMVHMESIQSGVERLEAGRLKSRLLETEYIKKGLDRTQSKNRPLEIGGPK